MTQPIRQLISGGKYKNLEDISRGIAHGVGVISCVRAMRSASRFPSLQGTALGSSG
jgi:hypothetical protein